MKGTGIVICGLLIFYMANAQQKMQCQGELILDNPSFAECHASTLVELGNGDLMVAFFGGSGESNKDVSIWLTRQHYGQWQKPFVIADGVLNDTVRYACWNPVLFRTSGGKLYLFYKVGLNPIAWWGMVRTSSNDGKDWSTPEALPSGFLGPIKNKPIELKDGSLLCPSSRETDSSWTVVMEKFSDGNWTKIVVDSSSSFKVIQPTILQFSKERLEILCRSDQNVVVAAWSSDDGRHWSAYKKLQLPNPNSGIDAVTLPNGLHLLVYNPTTKGKEWFNGRSRLHVAASKDGIAWKDIAVLEDGIEDPNAEFSYPAIIALANGEVHITYTYKRKNIKHVVLKPPFIL